MLDDVMTQIRSRAAGQPIFAGETLSPGWMSGMGGGIAPGIIVPMDENQPTVMGGVDVQNPAEVGRIGLTLLGIGVLLIVGMNLVTKGYRA